MFKYSAVYRQALRLPLLKLCQFRRERPANNILVNHVITLNESGGLTCPFQSIVAYNRTVKSENWSPTSIFPSGDYKAIMRFYTAEMESLVNLTIVASIKSEFHGSFGKK